MNEVTLCLFIGWILGVIFGYVIWAPNTRFKQNFINGLTLRFIWRRR
jgi:hypothetical protein